MTRLRDLLILVILMICPHGNAAAGNWFLALESGLGSAGQTLEGPSRDLRYDRIAVQRQSLALGYRHDGGLSGRFEISLSERGGQLASRSVYRPDSEWKLRFERDYLDLAASCSYRLTRNEGFASLGVGPRLSIFLSEDQEIYTSTSPKDLLVGVDPVLTVGYRYLYVSARYAWDIGPSYRFVSGTAKAEMHDSVYTMALGLEVAL